MTEVERKRKRGALEDISNTQYAKHASRLRVTTRHQKKSRLLPTSSQTSGTQSTSSSQVSEPVMSTTSSKKNTYESQGKPPVTAEIKKVETIVVKVEVPNEKPRQHSQIVPTDTQEISRKGRQRLFDIKMNATSTCFFYYMLVLRDVLIVIRLGI
jgi:hypothetical protein